MMTRHGIRAGWLLIGLGMGCDERTGVEPLDQGPVAQEPEAVIGKHQRPTALGDASGGSLDSSQPAATFELDVAKDGPDLVLTWSERDEGATYEVWFSEDPYFAPEDEGAVLLAEGLEGSEYVHAGGNDAVSRYYRVRVEGQDETSTAAGKLVTTLEPGYTKLGLCLDSEVDTAQELFDDMATPVQSAHMWSAEQQDWRWTWAAAPIELPLGTGQVVAVHHDPAGAAELGTYAMVGRVPVHGDVLLSLLPGDNIVTLLPSRGDLQLASEVLAAVEHATRIGRWDAQTQTTHWYPDEGDFEVSPCMPLHVEVTAPSTWPPQGYRRVIGPAGGTIEAYDGALRLDFPAGALTEDVEIRVAPFDYPTATGHVVPTIALEPHDIAFAAPVTLTMQYRGRDESVEPTDASAWLTRYSTDGSEQVLETVNDVEAGTLTASLETFSWVRTGNVCAVGHPRTLAITGGAAPLRVDEQVVLTAEFDPELTQALADGNPIAQQAIANLSWTAQPALVGLSASGSSADMTGQTPGATVVTATTTTCWEIRNIATSWTTTLENEVLSANLAASVMSCAERQAVGECPNNYGCTVGCLDGRCDSSVTNEGLACQSDANVCTGQTCQAGVCTTTSTLACNDGNVCTNDGCDATSGCSYTPNNGAGCPDDGNVCTYDVCSGGGCGHPPTPWGSWCWDDGAFWTDDFCNGGGGCIHPINPGWALFVCFYMGICG